MNIQELLKNPFVWVLGGALAASWLFGSWHALQAHGVAKAGVALLVPPYGVYMAAEQEFGHKGEMPDAGKPGAGYSREGDIAALANRCSSNAEGLEKSGLSKDAYDVWCACTYRMAIENLPEGENEYVAKNGRNSPEFAPILKQAQDSCYASAIYLGAPE